MDELDIIPAEELRQTVTIRHISAEGTQDDFGHYQNTTVDVPNQKCHFEYHTFDDESERVKNKEFILEYDSLLVMLPNASATQGDLILNIKANDGTVIYEDDSGNNPMTIVRVFKIAAEEGVHHLEVYCKFHNPQFNA